jgi:hemolysin activation/secretion protein
MKKVYKILVFSNLFIFALSLTSYSAPVPTGEQVIRTQELEQKDKNLREKIETEKPKSDIQKETPEQHAPVSTAKEKTLIKNITVIGVTLLSDREINRIITPYKNKELTMGDMQTVANLITDAYRQKGYITSRAYLPPQKIENALFEIRVLEGTMGDLQVKGNRFFRASLIKRKVSLKKGQPFNYDTLRSDMVKINELPDRSSKAVLVPGKDPGTTDLVLEVKDRLPIHIGFDWDNFGSRYIDGQRYSVSFVDNNLTGFDDKLTFQYQMSQSSRYYLKNIRYVLPLDNAWDIGGYAMLSRVKLGREFADQDVRGKSQVYGAFINNYLINTEVLDFNLSFGFDYKNSINHQNGAVTSHDRLRIAKFGQDLDVTDNFGRTILTNEFAYGIPNIMGGSKTKDSEVSNGAGGKFLKDTMNFLRLQRMPFSSAILWKSQIQLSPYVLPSSEQFQIGGINNVRGYPPAEAVGDRGYSTTVEWSFPPYLFPKNVKVPLSKANFYDAFRVVAFYDWANSRLKKPAVATDKKTQTLSSLGCGIRFNLPEDLSLRVEVAWPLDDKTASDGHHARTWASFSKSF